MVRGGSAPSAFGFNSEIYFGNGFRPVARNRVEARCYCRPGKVMPPGPVVSSVGNQNRFVVWTLS